MPTIGSLSCELQVPPDFVLRTHVKKQTKISIESIALIPALVPLPFSIQLRVADYYAFKTGFAAYVFIDREHHINGSWSGVGEGKGVFRGRQKTVDGRAVIDGEWQLTQDGVNVVKQRTKQCTRAAKRQNSTNAKDHVTTIEVVVLRTDKRVAQSLGRRDSGSSSEADYEFSRSDMMASRHGFSAAHLPQVHHTNSPVSAHDLQAYTWRNPLDEKSKHKDRRISEFESAIGKRDGMSSPRRPYSLSSSSAEVMGNKPAHDDIDELRNQLSAMLFRSQSIQNNTDETTARGPVSPTASVEHRLADQTQGAINDDLINGNNNTWDETTASGQAPTAHAINQSHADEWNESAPVKETAGGKSNVKRSSASKQNKKRRKDQKHKGVSDDETSSASSNSEAVGSDDSDSNRSSSPECTTTSSSDSSDARSSSSSSTASSSSSPESSDHNQRSKHRTDHHRFKPHSLYRKHWHYRDKPYRSRSFGGKAPRPPYQARHRITPFFLDTMERPYAIFKFRLANAETLQGSSELGLSADEVDGLRLRTRERNAILDALSADELREMVRSGCGGGGDVRVDVDANHQKKKDERKEEKKRARREKKKEKEEEKQPAVDSSNTWNTQPDDSESKQEQQQQQDTAKEASWGEPETQTQAVVEEVGGW